MATLRPCKLEIQLQRDHFNQMLSVHFANFDQNCATRNVLKITRVSRSQKSKKIFIAHSKASFPWRKCKDLVIIQKPTLTYVVGKTDHQSQDVINFFLRFTRPKSILATSGSPLPTEKKIKAMLFIKNKQQREIWGQRDTLLKRRNKFAHTCMKAIVQVSENSPINDYVAQHKPLHSDDRA